MEDTERTTESGNEARETANIFDKSFKRLMRLSDKAIVLFINGLFETAYSPESTVGFLSTETISDNLNRIISDVVISITEPGGEVHYYLVEAQIGDDEQMALRVFNYVYAEGLKHKTMDDDGVITIRLPEAKVIYWETTRKTPDKAILRVISPKGQALEYEVESFKFLDHSIEDLERHNMTLLLPFYMLKLRKRIAKAQSEKALGALSDEMRSLWAEMLEAIDRGEAEGQLSPADEITVLSVLKQMFNEVYKPYKGILEVNTMIMKDSPIPEVDARLEALWKKQDADRVEIAQKMVADHFPAEQVSKYTSLPIDRVQSLYSGGQAQGAQSLYASH